MKRRFELVKTLQLLLLVAISAAALLAICSGGELYQMVGRDPAVRTLCILLWLALALSFLGVFYDFSTHAAFKKNYRELDDAVYSDRLAGIANRYSCDAMIEKYTDRPLPDGLGCVMLDLTNIREINEVHGHLRGNAAIQDFSNILHTASLGLCFVGRNGGNKFMALFEGGGEAQINLFLTRVQRQVEIYNAREDAPRIEYRSGRALSDEEQVERINQLIALADRRLDPQSDRMTGLASRAGCDDIINLYLGKPLPEDVGCLMLDIVNIRQINESFGRLAGNRAIRHFGDALRDASAGLCFVGRNGGSKFLALFEECSEEKLDAFLEGVRERVERYNARADVAPVAYLWGRAFREGAQAPTIDRLVALSDRRLREKLAQAQGGTDVQA